MAKNNGKKIIPLPLKSDKETLQVEIDSDLYGACEIVRTRAGKKITKRVMTEIGLKLFLIQEDPDAAKKLGII